MEGHSLVAIDARDSRRAAVLSANGAAPARLTLARFHAPGTCGAPDIVTELVLAFPPGGASRHAAPSHGSVVALLDADPVARSASTPLAAPLGAAAARSLIRRVADRAEQATRGPSMGLLHPPTVDADQSTDAGEVVALSDGYGVGFRATFVRTIGQNAIDTSLITGVAATDTALHRLRWVVRPKRLRLHGGVIAASPNTKTPGARYSVRGAVLRADGGALLLIDEFADVSAHDSRATAVDARTGQVVAAQPLALRCP